MDFDSWIQPIWREVERGECRLAIAWPKAGEALRAHGLAQNCLDIVTTNDGRLLERFVLWEALGRVAMGMGDRAAEVQALAAARAAFAALDVDDRDWAQPSLAAMETRTADAS